MDRNTTLRWLLAAPLAMAALISSTTASEVRDSAGMFSADAVRRAETILDRSEASNGHPIVIETIPTLEGRDVKDVAMDHAHSLAKAQVYLLLAKKEKKFWVLERNGRFSEGQAQAIRSAFFEPLGKNDPNGALIAGAESLAIESASLPPTKSHKGGVVIRKGAPAGQPGGAGGWGFLLTIGLIVLAVLFGMRLLGGLFGAGRGASTGNAYGPPPSARPGMGMGGGYGPGGYGGRGGGFFSSILGGLGGAIAGNWMYNQFRGHDRGHTPYDSGNAGIDPGTTENADWGGGFGGEWGDSGDAGGGDVGGGGGDWGGGGGDWGGGDGGGDGGGWS